MEELQRTKEERRAAGEKAPIEEAATNVTRGTLEALNDPAQQEQLSRAVGVATESALTTALNSLEGRGAAWGGGPPAAYSAQPSAYGTPIGALGSDLSSGFALGFSRQLQLELGPDGSGPLGKSLSGLVQEVSGVAANRVVTVLTPLEEECAGADRQACYDRRVYELSRVAAVGLADGVVQRLRVPVLVLTFLAGIVVALIATAALRRRRAAAQA